MVDNVRWTASQEEERHVRLTTFKSLVTAVYLGHRFLENERPDLTVFGYPCKCPVILFGCLFEREVVINGDDLLFGMDKQFDLVYACRVGSVRKKHFFDSVAGLGDCSYG